MYWCFVVLLMSLKIEVSGHMEPRILDGKQLRYDLHKYLVELKVKWRNESPSQCSGSIIHQSWILSAAHCISSPRIYSITVKHYTGDSRLTTIAKINMNKVFQHPLYKPQKKATYNVPYDLALLKTKVPMQFDEYVAPIRLSKEVPKVGQVVNIAAFGLAEYGLAHREGFLRVEGCEMGVRVICTVSTVRAADGDSGGALVGEDGRLAGVISSSCRNVQYHADCLTVYTSVGASIRWIRSILASE